MLAAARFFHKAMPGNFLDLPDYATDLLTDAERLFLSFPVLTEESTVPVPTEAEIDAAVALLNGAGLQQLRMHLDGYRASNAYISGGQDAVTIDPVINRWAQRNRCRILLKFDAEPRPGGAEALRIVTVPLVAPRCRSEFGS